MITRVDNMKMSLLKRRILFDFFMLFDWDLDVSFGLALAKMQDFEAWWKEH